MRYLKRINEKRSYKELHEYIRLCFIDFMDGDEDTLEEYDDEYDYDEIIVNITMPWVKHNGTKWVFNKPDNIKDMVKYSEDMLEYYREIESCIAKVKIEYNVDVTFYYEYETGLIADIVEPFDTYLEVRFELK